MGEIARWHRPRTAHDDQSSACSADPSLDAPSGSPASPGVNRSVLCQVRPSPAAARAVGTEARRCGPASSTVVRRQRTKRRSIFPPAWSCRHRVRAVRPQITLRELHREAPSECTRRPNGQAGYRTRRGGSARYGTLCVPACCARDGNRWAAAPQERGYGPLVRPRVDVAGTHSGLQKGERSASAPTSRNPFP